MRSLLWPLCCSLALASPVKRSVPDFTFAGDVGWTVPVSTLASSLNCPYGYPTAASPPVLLVHGTFASGNETWNQTYVPALNAAGYTACYLELPQRAGIDMQVSAEYVAYNLHYISYLSGGLQTAVVTHSQGGPDTMWAFEWWPSTWAVTRAYLPLAPDLLGVTYDAPIFHTICPAYACEPSIWQQMVGSAFENALRAHKNFKAVVPSTLVWTAFDDIVTPPNQNALLTGGTTIGVQDVCPGRFVEHIYLVDDAVAYFTVLDALNHNGTADVARVLATTPTVCEMLAAPAMEPGAVEQLRYVSDGVVEGFA
ncbi:hypothetical protein AMS68_003839 [Peltaster fructicola]|uniref:AB hydrolase-1 domain-containing protein n=1 Tax=Peltaster fructicola TaxID=286661 RepID=A0A6H0XU84_9PEZI|nr:hypothetical protein AMS68_003839 [Peltaster fructicola]